MSVKTLFKAYKEYARELYNIFEPLMKAQTQPEIKNEITKLP
jgi:hypothetical protein